MRTPADCIHALNGCVRVGSAENWTVGVPETIVRDIIDNLRQMADPSQHICAATRAAKAMKDHYEQNYGAWSEIEQAVINTAR